MLVGSELLEKFIDHMERDDLVRRRWLKSIREKGFDQALSEYHEHTERVADFLANFAFQLCSMSCGNV